jgi:hypothetical protein
MSFSGSGNTPNDKIKYIYNPLEGTGLTPTAKFNTDRILTTTLNSAGQPKVTWNETTSSYVPDGPDVLVDINGNVLTVGN